MTGRPLSHEQQVNTPPGSMNLQVSLRIRTGHNAYRHSGAQWWAVIPPTAKIRPTANGLSGRSGSTQEDAAPAPSATMKKMT